MIGLDVVEEKVERLLPATDNNLSDGNCSSNVSSFLDRQSIFKICAYG